MVPNDKTNFEGAKIETPTGHIGLHRITKKLPQIFDGSSSCVNLIFTFQRNLVMKLGAYASLQTNCHHQAIYAKIGLQNIILDPKERVLRKRQKTI